MPYFGSKNIVVIVFFSFAFMIAAYFYKQYRVAPKIADFKVSFYDKNNTVYTINSFLGKNIVLIFSASWCRDCLIEIPALEELKKQLGEDKFEYIMLSDEPWNKIELLKKRTSFKIYQLQKPFKDYKIYSIPTAYVLNKNGEVSFSHVGNYNWNDKSTIIQITNAVNNCDTCQK